MNSTVEVAVGDGVSVLRGVSVTVAVGVADGRLAAVCVEAALAVCTINVLTALGSYVATGAAAIGEQASTSASASSQTNIFLLRIDIVPLMRSP